MSSPSAFGSWLEGMPVVAFECDAGGALLSISPHWTRLTGQALADALGAGWTAHLDGPQLSGLLAERAEALRRGERVEATLRCRDRDGAWRKLRTVVQASADPSRLAGLAMPCGEPEAHVEALRVEVEEATRHAAHVDAILSAWPDLLFVVSAEGVFKSYRAADTRGLYVAPERFLGRTFEEVLPPSLAELSREALERACERRRPEYLLYELTVSSEQRHFEARVLPTKTGDCLYVIRDITEARRSQEALIVAREDALERNRLKTQFLANVSHEIRTPLNGILGVTQLLKQHVLPEEVGEYVDVLQGAGESLLAIVDDVLDLSRIESNKIELQPRPFDLEQLVQDTARSFLALVQRKQLALTVDVAPEVRGPMHGDPARIRQIVTNLVGNAVKFTAAGEVRVTVRRLDATRVRLEVRDSGPGISPEHHERIFHAFEQADGGVQRRFGGTGLGLAITRQLARLMGGEVTLESALGAGSCFVLEVPLPPVVISHQPPVASRVTPVPRSMRVLLAEDEPVNATMTAALLRKLGHHVQVVGDGEACVAAVEGGEFDLVLMDVQMPRLDGLAATGRIRAREKGTAAHVPIVALTANAMKGDDLTCLSAGMDAYLPKPVTVDALKDLLLWFGAPRG